MDNKKVMIEWAGEPVEAEILKTMKGGYLKVRFADRKLYMIKVLPADQVFADTLDYHYRKLRAIKKDIYGLLQEKARIEKAVRWEQSKMLVNSRA